MYYVEKYREVFKTAAPRVVAVESWPSRGMPLTD